MKTYSRREAATGLLGTTMLPTAAWARPGPSEAERAAPNGTASDAAGAAGDAVGQPASPHPVRVAPTPDPFPKTPRLRLPTGAVDAHIHLFGPVSRYPFAPGALYVSEDRLPETYLAQMDVLGLSKAVVVSGGGYGQDYRHLVDTLRRFPDRFRGVARLPKDAGPETLAMLNDVGVRGARFFAGPGRPAPDPKLVGAMTGLGWHMQYYPLPGRLEEVADMLLAFGCPVVLDHFARLDPSEGTTGAGFRKLLSMLDTGRVWVKLSGPMNIARHEEFPYPSVIPLAQALVAHAPERMVWGSDWPHTGIVGRPMPNDGDLVDLIGTWIPDERVRKTVLVDNPARLYGF